MGERERETTSGDIFSFDIDEVLRWIPHELLLPRETYSAISTIPGHNVTSRSCVSGPRNYEGNFAAKQRTLELANTLISLKAKGVIREDEVAEILLQQSFVEQRRLEVLQHLGEVVVACSGELFYGRSLEEASKKAKEKCGDKPYYSETIGITNFPSPL